MSKSAKGKSVRNRNQSGKFRTNLVANEAKFEEALAHLQYIPLEKTETKKK